MSAEVNFILFITIFVLVLITELAIDPAPGTNGPGVPDWKSYYQRTMTKIKYLRWTYWSLISVLIGSLLINVL